MAIHEEDQVKFEDFHYTRKSFAVILADRKEKLKPKEDKKQEISSASSTPRKSKLRKETKRRKSRDSEEPSGSDVTVPDASKSEDFTPATSPTLSNGSKRAKKKPMRKKSATHKEDDDIIQ